MYRICIDAGHGGKDPGAIGVSGLKESDVNLAVALKVEEKLKAANKSLVFMVRRDDTYSSPTDRRTFSKINRCDLYISIHCNSYTESSANGIEVFCYEYNRLSEVMAGALLDKLIEKTRLRNRGVKKANFTVIKILPPRAAILLEIGFISNPTEEKLLANESYRENVAQCIYEFALGLSELNNVIKI